MLCVFVCINLPHFIYINKIPFSSYLSVREFRALCTFFFSLSYLPCFSSTNDQSHFDSPQGVSICWISSLSLSLSLCL